MESLILILYIFISLTTSSTLCDARSLSQTQKAQLSKSPTQIVKKLKVTNHIDIPLVASSPFSSPPSDSPAPNPLPSANVPLLPYCVNPQPPSTTLSPAYPPQIGPSPHQPCIILSPPNNPPTPANNPLSPPNNPPTPANNPLSPPNNPPTPANNPLSPPKNPLTPPPVNPSPTVHPPPPGPNYPPHKKPQSAVWCVAKPTVPDPIVQEAMDYACGSGADCKSIQPNGSCYQPDTLLSHASYAFNSYWQSRKVAGGTCDFGGTAMLVTIDPSFDGCQFFYSG